MNTLQSPLRRTHRIPARVLGRLQPGTVSVFIHADDGGTRVGARVETVDEQLVPVEMRRPGTPVSLLVLTSPDGEKVVGVVTP